MTLPPHYYQDLAHLNQWCIKLTNGQLHINRRFCPPLLPGEKYAHRIVFVSASTEDLQMPMFSWHTDIGISSGAYPEPNEGGLYVTDQRVILWRGPRFGSYGEWNWNQFEEAHLLRPTLGIALVPPNSDDHALILANKWRHGITPPAARKVLLNWLKIEATFHYSHGTLDDWMTQLPERLAAYYTNFTPLITSMEPQTADYTDPLHLDAHQHADQYASPLEPVATIHEWKPPTSAQKHEALNQVHRWTFSALAVFFACCSLSVLSLSPGDYQDVHAPKLIGFSALFFWLSKLLWDFGRKRAQPWRLLIPRPTQKKPTRSNPTGLICLGCLFALLLAARSIDSARHHDYGSTGVFALYCFLMAVLAYLNDRRRRTRRRRTRRRRTNSMGIVTSYRALTQTWVRNNPSTRAHHEPTPITRSAPEGSDFLASYHQIARSLHGTPLWMRPLAWRARQREFKQTRKTPTTHDALPERHRNTHL